MKITSMKDINIEMLTKYGQLDFARYGADIRLKLIREKRFYFVDSLRDDGNICVKVYKTLSDVKYNLGHSGRFNY